MKHGLIILLMFLFTNSFGQTEEEAVQTTIEKFFTSLNTQDTALMYSVTFREAQLWTINNFSDPAKHRMRFVKDDQFNPDEVYVERAYSYDIKVHTNLASAWVPYEFSVNGDFSHCGVDIFTLIKTGDKWKITNIIYSLDRDGCDELGETK
jgi:hypothetical protein